MNIPRAAGSGKPVKVPRKKKSGRESANKGGTAENEFSSLACKCRGFLFVKYLFGGKEYGSV